MPNLTNKHILTIIVSAVLLTLLVLVGFYATRDKEEAGTPYTAHIVSL